MFNHSSGDQNVGWVRDVDRLLITYRALRDIEIGEELCTSPPSLHTSPLPNPGISRLLDDGLPLCSLLRRFGSVKTNIMQGISYGARLTFVDADAPAPVNEGDGAEIFSEMQLGLDG